MAAFFAPLPRPTRKFVIEFTVEADDIKDWVVYQQTESPELTEEEANDWTAVDLLGSNWATGDELMSLRVTRAEELEE
jgi:hypothetical protein